MINISYSQIIGLGVNNENKFIISNSYKGRLKLDFDLSYGNISDLDIYEFNIKSLYKWLRRYNYTLSSGINSLVFILVEDKKWENKTHIEIIPIEVEVFPFNNNFSIFLGTRFKYDYIQNLKSYYGIKIYLEKSKKKIK